MKITAKAGGYSSVVGQSVMLQDDTGRVVCVLALLNVGAEDHKEKCAYLCSVIENAINETTDISAQISNLHPIEVLSSLHTSLKRARKGAFLDQGACDIVARALLEQDRGSVAEAFLERVYGKLGRETVDAVANGKVLPPWPLPHIHKAIRSPEGSAPTRWVKCDEREPTVGGTYFTGSWRGPPAGLRQFRQKKLFFIIHKDSKPQWYTFDRDRLGQQLPAFPVYWLEGLPGAPPDD